MSHDGFGYAWPDAASHRVRVAERCENPDCGALTRDIVQPFEPELGPRLCETCHVARLPKRRRKGGAARGRRQLGEQREKLRPLACVHVAHDVLARLEAFRPRAIGAHDLVPVEEDVDVAHRLAAGLHDARPPDEVDRRRQDLRGVDQESGDERERTEPEHA